MSCTYCSAILGDCILPHTEDRCPLKKSHYCSHCAVYGHRTADCKVLPDKRFTEPIYLEQLIGVQDRLEQGITSQTLIRPLGPLKKSEHVLEIKDDEQVIAAYIAARSIRSNQRKATKRQMLEEYAKSKGMRVVYYP